MGEEITSKSDKERRRESVKLHLSNEQLMAVGHVTLRSAILDKMIALTADRIAFGLHKTLQKQYRKFSIPQKLSLIQDALAVDLPEHEGALAEFIGEIAVARSHRNQITHSIWRSTKHPETKRLVQLISPTHPERVVRRQVTAKSMMELANQMADLTFEMADWKMLINPHMRRSAASRGIQPPQGAPSKPPRVSQLDLDRKQQRLNRLRAAAPQD